MKKITKEEIDKIVFEFYNIYSKNQFEHTIFLNFLYYRLYDKFPRYIAAIGFEESGKPTPIELNTLAVNRNFERAINDEYINDFIVELKGKDYTYYFILTPGSFSSMGLHLFINDKGIINISSSLLTYAAMIYSNSEKEINIFLKDVPYARPIKAKDPSYKYISVGDRGFDFTIFKLKFNFNIDLNKNYNDDLPFNELLEFCKSKSCGLSLLHGIPGCGKTTLIKNIIFNLPDVEFYILDASLLSGITNSNFLDFLMNKKNSVFILEDCEKLLLNRDTCNNPWIGTLLNLTDGMLGEGLGIKFICTFNANIKDIDKALLREGRLKINYELKPLIYEKSKIICKERNIPCKGEMTLAEIYSSKVDLSSLNKQNKIGF